MPAWAIGQALVRDYGVYTPVRCYSAKTTGTILTTRLPRDIPRARIPGLGSDGTERRREDLGAAQCQDGYTRDVAAPRSSGAINSRARFCGDIVLIVYDDRVVEARLGAKSLT